MELDIDASQLKSRCQTMLCLGKFISPNDVVSQQWRLREWETQCRESERSKDTRSGEQGKRRRPTASLVCGVAGL